MLEWHKNVNDYKLWLKFMVSLTTMCYNRKFSNILGKQLVKIA